MKRLVSDFTASVFYTLSVLNGSILRLLGHMYARKLNCILSFFLIQCPADTVYNSFFFSPYVTMYKNKKRYCNANIFLRHYEFNDLSWTGMILHFSIFAASIFACMVLGGYSLYIFFFSVWSLFLSFFLVPKTYHPVSLGDHTDMRIGKYAPSAMTCECAQSLRSDPFAF